MNALGIFVFLCFLTQVWCQRGLADFLKIKQYKELMDRYLAKDSEIKTIEILHQQLKKAGAQETERTIKRYISEIKVKNCT